MPPWLPDAVKVLGGLLLIYPALRVSRLSRIHYLFDRVEIESFPTKRLQDYLKKRKEQAFKKQFEWNLADQLVLFSGLLLVVAGDAMLLIEKVTASSPHGN